MGIIIQKFGGKLLETPERIIRAARYIVKSKVEGNDPVVVVSALGQLTDQYQDMAYAISDHPDEREIDMLLSVGERIAMSLLAMAINSDGKYKAVSFTGSQVGIITDTRHTDARILEVKGYRIKEALEKDQIPIIAGFQGISTEREITTLGRGGSDATAIALAVAIGADKCELIKESGGIFTSDPKIVKDAALIEQMDYTTLQSITEAGAKVVQTPAVSLANQHRIVLAVKNVDGGKGTLVSDRTLASNAVSSIVLEENHQLVSSTNLPKDAGDAAWNLSVESNKISLRTFKFHRNNSTVAIPVDIITIVGSGGTLDPDVISQSDQDINDSGTRLHASLYLHGKLVYLIDAEDGSRVTAIIHNSFTKRGFFEKNLPLSG